MLRLAFSNPVGGAVPDTAIHARVVMIAGSGVVVDTWDHRRLRVADVRHGNDVIGFRVTISRRAREVHVIYQDMQIEQID
jgi:hypothetical protein